jgi:hypothetical protein
MRLGESFAETYKQESLQQSANRLNAEANKNGSSAPRIETVETYFNIHLPYKVKDATGLHEEVAGLYGRQPTLGHGRGSDISSDVAYNPDPGAGPEPKEEFQGTNALQISNSGAIFDYGSMAITTPEALAAHGYHHFSQDAVNRGAFFNLFDSDINNFAYDLARAVDTKSDVWSDKRGWVLNQRKVLVPLLQTPSAPLTGDYAKLVGLYEQASSKSFTEKEAQELLALVSRSNGRFLGSNWLTDTTAMKSSRIEYLRLQTILAALTPKNAELLVDSATNNDRLNNDSEAGMATLIHFLSRAKKVATNHTEGMGDILLSPTYSLWDAMRKRGNEKSQNIARQEQFDNLRESLRIGAENSILKTRFITDLRSQELPDQREAVYYLYRGVTDKLMFAKKLLEVPEIQAALTDISRKKESTPLMQTRLQALSRFIYFMTAQKEINCVTDHLIEH